MARFYEIIEMRAGGGRSHECEILVGVANGTKYTLCYEMTYRDSIFHDAKNNRKAPLVLTRDCGKCGHYKAEYVVSSSQL